jgi:hypothetical protein
MFYLYDICVKNIGYKKKFVKNTYPFLPSPPLPGHIPSLWPMHISPQHISLIHNWTSYDSR